MHAPTRSSNSRKDLVPILLSLYMQPLQCSSYQQILGVCTVTVVLGEKVCIAVNDIIRIKNINFYSKVTVACSIMRFCLTHRQCPLSLSALGIMHCFELLRLRATLHSISLTLCSFTALIYAGSELGLGH